MGGIGMGSWEAWVEGRVGGCEHLLVSKFTEKNVCIRLLYGRPTGAQPLSPAVLYGYAGYHPSRTRTRTRTQVHPCQPVMMVGIHGGCPLGLVDSLEAEEQLGPVLAWPNAGFTGRARWIGWRRRRVFGAAVS